jgi:ferritin-like metal-binding protein YciE
MDLTRSASRRRYDWIISNGACGSHSAFGCYEMAGYGCVRTYAQLLGNDRAAKLLQQTLDEKGDTDKALTKLAETINVEAEEPNGAMAAETSTNGRSKRKVARR